nr:UDP-galactopyranose mutase [uncultured Lachnoclostridium sp.]
MERVKNLVVGAGLAGAVTAERIASIKKEPVLIIDRRNHIAGNIFDYKDQKTGITVHKYGPHVFHTNSEKVWKYLSQFTEWHNFMYKVIAVVDGEFVNIPFNFNSLYKIFPKTLALRYEEKLLQNFEYGKKIPILELKKTNDLDLKNLADFIYKKVFYGYTIKQWGSKPEELDHEVSARVPILLSSDNRYFQDRYQAIPKYGYTSLVKNILDNHLIEVRLNTDFKDIKNKISYDNLYFSGAIDEYYDYQYGELPYRSLDIKFKTITKEYYQVGPQINYPENYDFTRSVEYKYYLDEKSLSTIISEEYPVPYMRDKNERFYPVPMLRNQVIYNKYLKIPSNTKFIGRLGTYKYLNMDQIVENILENETR